VSRILSALSRKLGQYHTDSRGWSHFSCFGCGKQKLGVHLANMRWSCFVCHKSGWVSDLLKTLDIKLELEPRKPKPYRAPVLPEPPLEIPGFKRFIDTHDGGLTNQFLKDCVAYTQCRGGLGLTDLAERGWGYIQYGVYGMRLVIPIVQDRKIVNFIARSVYDFLEPKELAGPADGGWWPRPEIAMGLDEVSTGDSIVLVEGPWDKVNLDRALPGYTIIALLGSHISQGVAGRLLAKKPSRITFFLDGDDAGRNGVAAGVKLLKKRKFSNLYIVDTPDDKDPDELVDESANLVKFANHWMKD
jgi:hypothetical protein